MSPHDKLDKRKHERSDDTIKRKPGRPRKNVKKELTLSSGSLKNYDVDVNDPQARQKLKRRLRKVKSVFKSQVGDIQDLLDNSNNDVAITIARRNLLKMLTELIPFAEANYRQYGNERAAYALNTLITQMRELIADIQSEHNKSELLMRILTEIMHPRFLLLGQHIIDVFYYLRTSIQPNLKSASELLMIDEINGSAKNTGKFIEEMYKDIQRELTRIVSE